MVNKELNFTLIHPSETFLFQLSIALRIEQKQIYQNTYRESMSKIVAKWAKTGSHANQSNRRNFTLQLLKSLISLNIEQKEFLTED